MANVESRYRFLAVYERLYYAYGPQHWWPGETALEIIIGAILTQAAAWINVERALKRLKSASLLSTEALRDIPETDLAAVIRPSGYFNAKAKKIKAFIGHLWSRYDGDVELFLSMESRALRWELLAIYGIGDETADDILLYAAEKPVFVIDAYTRRIIKRLGLAPERESYGAYQQLFHEALMPDTAFYNEYHALLDRHAKEKCKKNPICEGCCLIELCPTGRSRVDTYGREIL